MLLFGIIATTLILIAGLLIYSGPRLPFGTSTALEDANKNPAARFAPGKSGYADSNGIKIWYEAHGNATGEAVIIIMGLNEPLTAIPANIITTFVDAGYHVITMDNRDIGLSDWNTKWRNRHAYRLEDMANDAIAVLDALEIEQAHVVGKSMGGMIGQRLAISYPDRILSLASIMSSGWFHDPELTQFSRKMKWGFTRLWLRFGNTKSEKQYTKYKIGTRTILSGTHGPAFEPKTIAEFVLNEFRKRRGFNGKAFWHHLTAIRASGSRLHELEKIKAPTVILHGTADPLVLPEHAEKYAPLIPGAEMVWIAGLGHTLPEWVCDPLCKAIIGNFRKIHTDQGHLRIEWKKGTL